MKKIKVRGFRNVELVRVVLPGKVCLVRIQGKEVMVAWDCEAEKWATDQALVEEHLGKKKKENPFP